MPINIPRGSRPYIWMLGFRYRGSFYFSDSLPTYVSIPFAAIFAVFAILTLVKAIQIKSGGSDYFDVSSLWLVFGILLLVLPVVFSIIIHLLIYETETTTTRTATTETTTTYYYFFWSKNYPFFGIFFVLFGGILILVAAILAKKA